jgi:hypothetical protein
VDIRNAYKSFVGKPERKRLHGISKCRWMDIEVDLKE